MATKGFPEKGLRYDEIIASINTRKKMDAEWRNGKTFGYVYQPDEDLTRLLKDVYDLFFFYNALNITLFPSLVTFENETISMVRDLLNGDRNICGNITSGGTESIFMAVKSARDKAKLEHPEISQPVMIIPRSAHPAFNKAAHYLGIKIIQISLRSDYRADIQHLLSAIDRNTIMIVGSAPTYSHGVIDPIAEMGKVALEHQIWFHVDACLGGFILPFIEKLGYPVPPFDFRVPGVTSISADVHKYGYGAKGASIILYRNKELRKNQFFIRGDWPGGLFGSATLLGTKSGGPIVAAWATIKFLGSDGYLKMTEKTMAAVKKIQLGVSTIPGLHVISDPEMSVFAITSDNNNIFQIGDELGSRGWHLDRIMEPEGIHLNITNSNTGHVDEFLKDLEEITLKMKGSHFHSAMVNRSQYLISQLIKIFPKMAADKIGRAAANDIARNKPGRKSKTATFYGIAARQSDKQNVDAIILDFLDKMYDQSH